MDNLENKSIILFDGVCNLCNASVNFVIKHDKKAQFLFASFQSDAAKEILLHFNLKNFDSETVILVEGQKLYDKSTAALKIAKRLDGGFKLFYAFLILPKNFRDWIYDLIAKNRYRWFGKRENCIIPSAKLKNRFLD
ncbi:MAG: thiol-disulfide oxidoreductase [Lutibacter sp. BRH_c52]|nr:MAG: thiol-disulfide oxidoreductase [Lutibacter sp. BRH_c52]KUO69715.1 MAG: thiol-disulfide oxidoreductase [Lutibacter sp. BRH_c52]HCE54505.1 thiol-disulfide oxidoreductase [Lutibacter sp.]